MKRRNFIKFTAIGLGAAPSLGQAGRIFGTPDSLKLIPLKNISSHITLPLSRTQIPASISTEVANYSMLWNKVLSDKAFNTAFFRNPRQAMLDNGLTDLANYKKHELTILMSLRDKEVLDALESRNYSKFFSRLGQHHITKSNEYISNNRLDEINNFIQQKGLQMKAQYDKLGLKANNRIPELVNSNELAYMASSMCGNDTAFVAAAAVLVIVAAAVVTYVAVGVNVAAGLNVGVYLSVVTKVAVATSGAAAAAMPASAARITTSQNGWLYNAVNNADIPDLTTVGYDSLMTAAKISKMSGDTVLNHLTVNEIIKREIDTTIKAAEDSGMLHIHPSQRDNVIQAATSYTLKVMGVKN